MTWDTGENTAKLIGWVLFGVAAVTTIAKVWTNTAKDKLIEIIEKELSISRQHIEQCDRDVLHYREEMHEVRKECQAKILQSDSDLLLARETMKQVEIENARLMERTDLTPLMSRLTDFITEQRKFTQEQTAINERVLKALQQLTDSK